MWNSRPPCFPPSANSCVPCDNSGDNLRAAAGRGLSVPLSLPYRLSMASSEGAQPQLGAIEYQGRKFMVSVRVAFDGIEFVGRLWFAEEDWDDPGLPDRAAIPGRTREEVLEQARRFTAHELGLRHRRALAEKRRFIKLRGVTDDILTKIRYINQIAI